ncbi:MAG TPA: GNAT family N-acetyltransferase [Janthinobacterium sp.]|nr:GNAT family N-acetyltransferase [Janthinobacterium sp.]
MDHKSDAAILDAWLGNKTPEMVTSWFDSSTNFSLVAAEADEVVGVALLTRAGKVALCYVLPEAQGRGAGKAMLQRLEAQAGEWSVKALQLYSTATAESFFAGQGYAHSGNVRSPYGVETIHFWKQLDAGASAPEVKRKRFCNCNPT